MIREGPDYQAVLPDHGAPMLPDTEDVAGVRDDPRVWNDIKALARCYCDLEKKVNILEERVNVLTLEKCYMQMYIDDLHRQKEEPFVLPTVDQLKRFSPSMSDDCPPPPQIRRGAKKSKSLESVEECPTPAPVRPVTTAIVPTATYTATIVPTAVVTPVISYPCTTSAYVEEAPIPAPVRKSNPFVSTI